MHQRLQASGSLNQQQSVIDQQKQLYPSQRPLSETSTMSVDSSAQTGHMAGGDWQEEAYQKMKSMREAYLPELTEMHQKISMKLQQHESLPQQPKSEQLEKLKAFKVMLERLIAVLQVNKADIGPTFKDKLVQYEKQIINFINTGRPTRKLPVQQGQLPPTHMHSLQQQQQQSQPQINQVQSHENQMNPQLQSMNLQGSVASMQQNNMGNLRHNSMSSLSGVSNAQQTMINSLQPNSNMDSGQGSALSTMQQVGMGSMQQNSVSAPQQVSMSTMPQQGGVNMLQPNVNTHQSNSNMLQHQHLNQQQEQQMLQTQQLKQQYQQRQMQQQLKQQLLQQQQHQQQLQQAKQQLPSQLQTQVPQLHQMNDGSDIKIRPAPGETGFCAGREAGKEGYGSHPMAALGGVHGSGGAENNVEVESLGRFAVDEHNRKENGLLEFARVLKAHEQVVAGTLHHLTIEAVDAGKKKLYEAKIWVKPWMHFKELQEFKHAGDVPSFTPSDLGARRGGHCRGWQEVPVHDPEVQDAANHAVKTIQQRSNSLFPYELHEIVHAKAEVAENLAKFDMLLKVKRGDKEEKFKVEVHKNHEGILQLNQMVPEQS